MNTPFQTANLPNGTGASIFLETFPFTLKSFVKNLDLKLTPGATVLKTKIFYDSNRSGRPYEKGY